MSKRIICRVTAVAAVMLLSFGSLSDFGISDQTLQVTSDIDGVIPGAQGNVMIAKASSKSQKSKTRKKTKHKKKKKAKNYTPSQTNPDQGCIDDTTDILAY